MDGVALELESHSATTGQVGLQTESEMSLDASSASKPSLRGVPASPVETKSYRMKPAPAANDVSVVRRQMEGIKIRCGQSVMGPKFTSVNWRNSPMRVIEAHACGITGWTSIRGLKDETDYKTLHNLYEALVKGNLI